MNRFMEMNTGGTVSMNVSNSLFSANANDNGSGESYNNNNNRGQQQRSNSLFPGNHHYHHHRLPDEATNKSNSSLFPLDMQNHASNTSPNRSNNIFQGNSFHNNVATNSHNTNQSNTNHRNHPFSGGDIHNERLITPDFSIFSSSASILEPLPMSVHRNPQHQAALQSMLQQSVDYLFGDEADKKKKKAAAETSGKKNTNNKRKRRDSMDPLDHEGGSDSEPHFSDPVRFRAYQAEQWDLRLEDLQEFRRIHQHCSVPYDYPPNPTLARWVKRQRYQYKLFKEGQASAMTERRSRALESIGFVWDTYSAAWERRISELRAYSQENGDCNVPATYQANKKLAAWVKCQRRQYKLFQEGKSNTLTPERIEALNRVGFYWELRSYRT